MATAEKIQQFPAGLAGALRDNLDPAIWKVRGRSRKPEFERARPNPPAKPDALDPPVDLCGQPHPCRAGAGGLGAFVAALARDSPLRDSSLRGRPGR
jgi:hypothetical protein